MGAAVAVLPAAGHNPSIFDALDDGWCSKCVLSPPRVFNSVPEDRTRSAVEDRVEAEDSRSRSFDGKWHSLARSTENDHGVGPSDEPAGVGSGSGLRWCHSVDEAELRAVFRAFDENADGVISVQELRRFTKVFGIEMSEADAESMIASVVGNRKHVGAGIDFQKFCCLYRTHLVGQESSPEDEVERAEEDNDNLMEAFKVFDKNGDGLISAEELRDVLQAFGLPEGKSLRQCTKMIQNVDSDGDGECDISENDGILIFIVFYIKALNHQPPRFSGRPLLTWWRMIMCHENLDFQNSEDELDSQNSCLKA